AAATGTAAASTGPHRTTPSGRPWRRGYVVLRRRSFLAQIAAGGFTALNLTRRLLAQAGIQFRPLARPTVVPLDDLSSAWRARPFIADATTLPSAANPNQPLRVSGTIVRIGGAGGGDNGGGAPSPEQFN